MTYTIKEALIILNKNKHIAQQPEAQGCTC